MSDPKFQYKFSEAEKDKAYECGCCCHDILCHCMADSWGACCIAPGQRWRAPNGLIYKELFDFGIEVEEAYHQFRVDNQRAMTMEEHKEFDTNKWNRFLELLPEEYREVYVKA